MVHTDGYGLTPFHHSIAGAVSGCLTRVSLQPLDVLKIRFQLQLESRKHRKRIAIVQATGKPFKEGTEKHGFQAKYSNIIQATHIIVKEEGLGSLWKGHVPAQFLSILYGAVQFTAFEQYTQMVWKSYPDKKENVKWTTVVPFVCGGLSGMTSTLVSQPFDVLRTRLVAQGNNKLYYGVLDAVRQMYREQGIRTFYKGTLPTMLLIFPNAGFQFGFYRLFKVLWRTMFGQMNSSPVNKLESITCGAASGIASKTLLLPFDTVKKRLQVVGFEEARKYFGAVDRYTGMIDCCKRILMDEGIAGFYKGTSPSVIKAAFSVALSFFFYEQCCLALRTTIK